MTTTVELVKNVTDARRTKPALKARKKAAAKTSVSISRCAVAGAPCNPNGVVCGINCPKEHTKLAFFFADSSSGICQ